METLEDQLADKRAKQKEILQIDSDIQDMLDAMADAAYELLGQPADFLGKRDFLGKAQGFRDSALHKKEGSEGTFCAEGVSRGFPRRH